LSVNINVSIRKNGMYQLEDGSRFSSLISEITIVPQEPLKEKDLQLAKKVDRTVCVNTPCMLAEPTQSLRDMYVYYVGNRTVNLFIFYFFYFFFYD